MSPAIVAYRSISSSVPETLETESRADILLVYKSRTNVVQGTNRLNKVNVGKSTL